MSTIKKWFMYPFVRSMVTMPGRSYRGAAVALTPDQATLRKQLEKRVRALSVVIGERSLANFANMTKAMTYVVDAFADAGYVVTAQAIFVDGQPMFNYIAEKVGSSHPEKIVVIGAHYDTVPGSPGADDNATGVAALLEMARILQHVDLPLTVRFVAFANEEHPGALAETMGSYLYARSCRERDENIDAMLSLEMLGYYSDEKRSQRYPEPFNLFYPTTANFIGFVGNTKSLSLVRRCVASFRKGVRFPSEGVAAPDVIKDVGRSDHWGFWQFGYPALMVTDTSNFRYQCYHTPDDTLDKIDFRSFTIVVCGLLHVVCDLAGDASAGKALLLG